MGCILFYVFSVYLHLFLLCDVLSGSMMVGSFLWFLLVFFVFWIGGFRAYGNCGDQESRGIAVDAVEGRTDRRLRR